MNREQELLQDIENHRKLLNEKAEIFPLISEDMIHYSHKLDLLLNEYEDLKKK
jgi:hypothetical protein